MFIFQMGEVIILIFYGHLDEELFETSAQFKRLYKLSSLILLKNRSGLTKILIMM